MREKIIYFSKKYSVTAEPEYPVEKDGGKQVMDVFLKIADKDEEDIAYVLIENKIKIASANKLQVSKQYEYFIHREDYQRNLPVYSLLITSDYDTFSSMHMNALKNNLNSVWLKWTK